MSSSRHERRHSLVSWHVWHDDVQRNTVEESWLGPSAWSIHRHRLWCKVVKNKVLSTKWLAHPLQMSSVPVEKWPYSPLQTLWSAMNPLLMRADKKRDQHLKQNGNANKSNLTAVVFVSRVFGRHNRFPNNSVCANWYPLLFVPHQLQHHITRFAARKTNQR